MRLLYHTDEKNPTAFGLQLYNHTGAMIFRNHIRYEQQGKEKNDSEFKFGVEQ